LLFRELRLRGHINFSGINLGARMKSGGPWNLRGLRPEARAAARDAARRSGMSVGEWLNAVIRPADEREAQSRRSERSDHMESGREPVRHREPLESDYDRDRERERYSGRREFQRSESHRRSSSERPGPREWGFGDDDTNRSPDREQRYDRPKAPRERPRNESRRRDPRDDARESIHSDRPDRDSRRYRESLRSTKTRDDDERSQDAYWREESPGDESDDKRQREKNRILSNREPDEDRFEPRNTPESDRYPEWDRSPPRLASKRQPEDSWQGFAGEEADSHFGKSPRPGDTERADVERSNFDHERGRAARRRASFESEAPFETTPRESRHPHERDSAPGRYAFDSDYRADAEPGDEDSLRTGWDKAGPYSGGRHTADQWGERFSADADEPTPRRDAGAWTRTGDPDDLPPQRVRLSNREDHRRRRDAGPQRPSDADDEAWPPEQDAFRGENSGLGGPYRDLGAAARIPSPNHDREDRDEAVDKAIAEITVRQRALEEAAAAETAARLRRAEVRAAQQQAASDFAANTRQPSFDTPAPPRPHTAKAPAPHKVTDDLVAEITARMRALDSEAAAERQTGAGKSAAQRSFVDDMADDASAERPERDSGGSFSLGPVSPDRPAERGSSAGSDGRKNAPALGVEIATIERQLRQLTGRIEGMRPGGGGDLKTSIDGLRRELSDMGKTFTEALPRRALESLEFEIKKLGRRLDDSRQTGGDLSALAVIEGGLAEVRDGLRGLTPAEELVGFGDAVAELTQKVDAIVARNDGGAIEQLRITMGDLRQAVSHVASDDSVKSVADEVRLLSGRIDGLGDLAKDDSVALEQLHDAIGGLRHAVAGVASGDALSAVADEVRLLSGKVDGLGEFAQGDAAALQQLNSAIGDLRHAVAGVATGEGLSTVGDEVRLLSAKVDSLSEIAKGDPGAMEQLHIAISNLRHAVSRVASDDAVSRLGEEVRLLSAKMDDLSQNAANNRTLVTIESRIDALTTAIHASTKNGQPMPRELEKLLAALIDKLELSQLTQTDHTALTHLEDRITMLMQRLDASDARLGLLEGVERGLADLLVYVEQMRGGAGGHPASGKVVSPSSIDHQFTGFKDSERRTQDSIEAVQGTVDHVVDRLARLESDMRINRSWSDTDDPLGAHELDLAPSLSPIDEHEAPADARHPAENELGAKGSIARTPIDPDLPPDHPLEPGLTRRPMTPVERLSALDSAVPGRPPIIPDPPGGKADFIAAARRAAQAASSSSNEKSSVKTSAAAPSGSKKLSERLRTLFVAAAVVAIVVGGFRVVSQMLDHGSPSPQAPTDTPRVLTEPSPGSPMPLTPSEPGKQPSAPGRSSDANTTNMPKTVMVPGSGADAEQNPAAAQASAPAVRQTLVSPPGNFAINSGTLPDISDAASKNASGVLSGPDVTGSLPPPASANSGPLSADKLPIAIGGPGLRAAALAGDPAASYEVGVRFAEGRNIPQNNEEAAHWLEAAAKKGFVPAQFRLGTLYEKGVGVKKDLPQALSFYRAAAEKGHGKAMHNLAVLYAEGATGAPDYRSASQWFRKAAELGVTDSQFNLAILYARGVGVEQSFSESYKWFSLAAKQGDKDAAQKRDEVAGRLDAPTLAAAKSAADQWTAQPQSAEAIAVKASEAWDPPAKPTSALKSKSHSAEKVPAPDVMKIN
jgi:localization factor PodJL